MATTDLEKRPASSGPLNPSEWETLAKITNTIAATEFVPKGMRGNKAAVMACVLYGRDQGLSPMVALSEISMVDGKPTMSAALMAAKIRAAGHKVSREEVRRDGVLFGMTAHGQRDDGTIDSFTFDLDMAKRAGLAGKKNWQTYPEAMLWARAVSQLARFLFSDVFIGSVYTPDEMGADDDSSEFDDGPRPVVNAATGDTLQINLDGEIVDEPEPADEIPF